MWDSRDPVLEHMAQFGGIDFHVKLLNQGVPGTIGDTWDSSIRVFLGYVGLKGPPSVVSGINFQRHLEHVGFVGLLFMGIWDTWDFEYGAFGYLVGHLIFDLGTPRYLRGHVGNAIFVSHWALYIVLYINEMTTTVLD